MYCYYLFWSYFAIWTYHYAFSKIIDYIINSWFHFQDHVNTFNNVGGNINTIWDQDGSFTYLQFINITVLVSHSLIVVVSLVVSLVTLCACGSSMHQKGVNYALTNWWFGLCRSMWIIELLVNLPSTHPIAPTRPSTFKVLRAKERTQLLFLLHLWTWNWVHQGA